MAKLTKSLTIQVPIDIVYKFLKEWDTDVNRLLADMGTPYGAIIEDIPNTKVAIQWKSSGVTVKLVAEIRSIGEHTEVILNVDAGMIGGKTNALISIVYFIGGLKGLERGYLSAKKG